ncbi:hypothetical protein BGW38_006244, partial [Lunasporangiospora selenospora]
MTKHDVTAGTSSDTISYKICMLSLDRVMTAFRRFNFVNFGGSVLRLELFPRSVYDKIPHVAVEFLVNPPLKDVYWHFMKFGQVISVLTKIRSTTEYIVYFAEKEHALKVRSAFDSQDTISGGSDKRTLNGVGITLLQVVNVGSDQPDFWKAPSIQYKGSAAVDHSPTLVAPGSASSTLKGSPSIGPPSRGRIEVGVAGHSGNFGKASASRPATIMPTAIMSTTIMPTSVGSSVQHRRFSDGKIGAIGPSTTEMDQEAEKKFKKTSATQRDQRLGGTARVSYHPGSLSSKMCNLGRRKRTFQEWCDSAFISYETLYNFSSKSEQGVVSISTLTWGSQLDISTFRLHYGSLFTPNEQKRSYPVASCLTVETRQYGDKNSAGEVLSIRNAGRLPETCEAMEEGMNVTARGKILSMRCLESGHLITSSDDAGLYLWDMSDNSDVAKVPLAKLNAGEDRKLFFDAKGMQVCSIDHSGNLRSYDLTKAVTSSGGKEKTDDRPGTAAIAPSHSSTIDSHQDFYTSSISINSFDTTVLTSSYAHAQVACWDPRSPQLAVKISTSCSIDDWTPMDRGGYDQLLNCEWCPKKSHEFMTASRNAIRIWDIRKLDGVRDVARHPIGDTSLLRAQYSPHRSDIIAGLTEDGDVRIWNLKSSGPPEHL